MPKRLIKLKFQNGLFFNDFKKEVFDIDHLAGQYDFEESPDPDIIIFGPYGNDIPEKGRYIRVGYFCENIKPDMSVCEWAFGVPSEADVNHPRYKRIQWHGITPELLIKPDDYKPDEILAQKKHFCNFLYSNKVAYREEFFRQLSKYKKVDAPGRSMNNMPGIDNRYKGNAWERKRQFLGGYKFTIAFENYVSPGYQTEKLYDAMQANSIPVYCGDPLVAEIFNTKSFINAAEFIHMPGLAVQLLQKYGQMNFKDIRPAFYNSAQHRVSRIMKASARRLKMKMQFGGLNFGPLIERIIELDRNDNAYMATLKQPWFINNQPPENGSNKQRWEEIFSQVNER